MSDPENTEPVISSRYARLNRPSSNLVGGTQPLPEPEPPTSRAARFERPSSNLVGGTQPLVDDVRHRPQPELFTLYQAPSDNASFSIPQPTARTPAMRWLGPGESVILAGLQLPDGLIYLGHDNEHARMTEASFIDTSLPVRHEPVPPGARRMPYWPRYADLPPQSRWDYLNWLAQGRSDPAADTGHVFLFFYGLERRALLDAASDEQARAELPAIKAEVQRLRALYKGNSYLDNHAGALLEWLDLADIAPRLYLQAPQPMRSDGYDMPIRLQIILGQMAADKYPLNARWALAWVLTDYAISRRTVVTRCPQMFERVFFRQFDEQFPEGLKLPRSKTRLKPIYHAASPTLFKIPALQLGDLPDLTVSTATRNRLLAVVELCTTQLDAFSRYRGRNPDQSPDALEGLLLLPVALWPESAQQALAELQQCTTEGALQMSMAELTASLGAVGALSRDRTFALATILQDLQIGMEPDVLAGVRVPGPEESVVLFKGEADAPDRRTCHDYQVVRLTLALASGVLQANANANANATASPTCLAALDRHIDAQIHLMETQRTRLKANLQLHLAHPPTLASLKRLITPLELHERFALTCLLVHVAQADGPAPAARVRQLEKVYKALKLDPQSLYSDLHGAAARAPAGPVQAAGIGPQHSPAGAPAAPVVLDMARIVQLQRETAQVSAMLAQVFQDDAAHEVHVAPEPTLTSAPATPAVADHGPCHYGLDAGHSALLRLLVSRPHWQRHELEPLAAGLDLMLDGALEQINDMAYDQFDMPLCEGDEPIEINPDILNELTL